MPISFRERMGTLRVRLLMACALALLGLTAVVGATLHQVFEQQSRDDLRRRTELLARAAAAFASRTVPPSTAEIGWLLSDADFESLQLFDADGREIGLFPPSAVVADETPRPAAPTVSPSNDVSVMDGKNEMIAFAEVLGSAGVQRLELRTSTARLQHELQNIRWLFGSIFLFAGAVFAALALYLTRGVVLPLEEVRRAASRIVNGEQNVRLPVSGDLEIDEIARFFHSLAERTNGAPSAPKSPAGPLRSEATHRAS
jgi:hypothetical protein